MNGVYRHELKYLINQCDWAAMRTRLSGVLSRDGNVNEHGEYWIRSLYFDDWYQSAYQEKEVGILARHKYRIRVYDCGESPIHLERKGKVGQYINKVSAPLTRGEVECILNGEYAFLEKSPHKLLNEFYYECVSRVMRPRVIVDYDREPFVMEAGDVRITFDKHVRAGTGSFDLFDPTLPTLETLPADRMILEVKFTQFLPKIVRRLLPPASSEMVAASKFVLCCDACPMAGMLPRAAGLPLVNSISNIKEKFLR